MKHKITLKHIAKELDVSISTVSKALKNSEEISRDTRERIQAFAKLYNYRPNNIAVSLKNKRTKNIGVVIPEIVHHFFTTVVRGIEKVANSKGYNVIVCVSDESFDKEVINMEMLANGSIDGFIMSLASETQRKNDYNHLNEVTGQGIPMVLFDRVTDRVDCDKVVIDDSLGGYRAAERLLKEGRRRIALITTDDYLSVARDREAGFVRAHTDRGLEVDPSLVLHLSDMEVDADAIRDFLRKTRPDGLVSVNEIFALFAMRVVRDLGLEIPKDVSIIGFTDGLLSRYAHPPMTAIAQHGDRMGAIAAEMLIGKIEDEAQADQFQTRILEPTLIERESTIP